MEELSRTTSAESIRSWQQLSTASGASTAGRKARSSEPETGGEHVERASVSMPPLASSTAMRQLPARRPSKASVSESIGSLRGTTVEDVDATPTALGVDAYFGSAATLLPDSSRLPRSDVDAEADSNKRLSFNSLFSVGSAIYANSRGHNTWSGRSSMAESEAVKMEGATQGTTTATSSLSVTTSTHNGTLGPKLSPTQLLFSPEQAVLDPIAEPDLNAITSPQQPLQPPVRRSRSRTAQRRISGSQATSSSPASMKENRKPTKGIIGVCALESKARSKPARNIFGKLVDEFEVKIFGDKIILDEEVENWPVCDFLISFFSDGFPLDKAIAYARLRKPFCVNDLPMQQVLWDRRLCLNILDKLQVPTPKRVEVNRDGGPILPSAEIAKSLLDRLGLSLPGASDGTGGGSPAPQKVELIDDGNTICVDGQTLTKPFVEKPVSGEDHNIHIYFHKNDGGGGRRLFRKINNKSSEKDNTLEVPRSILEPSSSYIYEQFLQVENAEDVKAYTVGPDFCHAETRKSPVVDGLVKRNPSGKEVRYVTKLNEAEAAIASRISEGFGQRVCGFDLLRAGDQSYVIDVNGWSFVKDNGEYYDRAANILKEMFLKEIERRQRKDATQPGSSTATSQDGSERPTATSRKSMSNHRQALKGLFKSPSMSRMANNHTHLPHMRHSQTVPSSPDISLSTTPVAASPTVEKPNPIAVLSPPTVGTLREVSPSEPDLRLSPALQDQDLHVEEEAAMSDEHVVIPPPAMKAQWKLKGVVSVTRHADRTPKQKFKYTFHSKPFVDLLKGHQAEVLLIGEAALQSVSDAVRVAMDEGIEDHKKLRDLQLYLNKKGAWPGTKVQIKPMFRKRRKEELLPGEILPEDSPEIHKQEPSTGDSENAALGDSSNGLEREHLKNRSDSMSGVTLSRITAQDNNMVLDKLQLIIKWGGEPTHSARHQTQDMGANFRNDLLLMNRDVLDDVHIFSSSERRVTTSAQIFGASFLEKDQYPAEHIHVRKDLLDDSNAAKDVMDKVKKRLKTLLRAGDKAPPQFAWPKDVPEPYIVVRQVVDLMKFHQRVMNHNFKKIETEAISSLSAIASPPGDLNSPGASQYTNVNHIQSRWCCNEGPELFKERWEKLFKEFKDADKVDPSKISELYDSMKFDALHNRAFLEWVFTPDASFVDEEAIVDGPKQTTPENFSTKSAPAPSEAQIKLDAKEQGAARREERASLTQRMGFRRMSEIATRAIPAPAPPSYVNDSYFKLYTGVGNAASRVQTDARLVKLREMYHLCKVLFDYIGPQEYGIESEEKLEIGLLTSLPLLKEIVGDLEELQASDTPKCFFYFTKESHIYTLLNCVLEGGIKTKIERNAIPELDYLSQINFELYESENASTDDQSNTFNYSIRITLSPGCHAFAPLDVQLDSRHMIGFSTRRGLTAHQDWKEVLETLRAKFHTVKLPKSFVAIDLSEKVPDAFDRRSNGNGNGNGNVNENGKGKENESHSGRGRSEEKNGEDVLHAVKDSEENGYFATERNGDAVPKTELPPPALDA